MNSSHLPTAVRAWSEAPEGRGRRRNRRREDPPDHAIVFDTETTTDPSQALLFGSWRLYRIAWVSGDPHLMLLDEGLFVADDLRERDPDAVRTIQEYVRGHQNRAHRLPPSHPLAWPHLRLMSASEFMRRILLPKAWGRRNWFLVGFNLPFDLSRLVQGWGEGRGDMAGGFSLVLDSYGEGGSTRENRFRPRFRIKTVDSKRHLMGFAHPAGLRRGRRHHLGHCLDLRTLAFAHTDRGHSLESACRAFGVPFTKREVPHGRVTSDYLNYNREDVWATGELLRALLAEHARHPIDLLPSLSYSPASVGKAYLRTMGVRPVLERQPRFPREVLAAGMEAFYGGRAECRIRRVPVPVVYVDFLSMYPTVNALMGLWDLVTAERVEVRDDTEAVRSFLDTVTLEDCFRPDTWRGLPALVQIQPEGDVLPVRAVYEKGGDWGIGINPFRPPEPRWYALPDVVASKLLTHRSPRVLRALRLVGVGRQAGLRPVRLRGEVPVDPARSDFFRKVVEERRRLRHRGLSSEERARLDRSLKVLANAASYGIYAEIVRHEQPGGARVEIRRTDGSSFECDASAVEEPGEYAFPPMAAVITAAARLMLAMLESCVSRAGGTYAMCDTDSMAVVATEDGGTVPCPGGPLPTPYAGGAVRALSHAEVDRIVSRFTALNPYDREAVPGSVLKLEEENLDPVTSARRQLYCYAISAKRYAFFNLVGVGSRPIVRKHSEHGLGHLLNPTDPQEEDRSWIASTWELLISEGLGLSREDPAWLDRPAISRITASTPLVLGPFRSLNRGKPYADQVKPFNFLLSAHVATFGHPEGADPTRFHLVAPYEADPGLWEAMEWTDLYSGRRYRISTLDHDWLLRPRLVRVKTYRDVIAAYRVHPEGKSLGPDGEPCGRATVGLLSRRPVASAGPPALIGKESNRLEEVQAGLVHDPSEVLNVYRDPERDEWFTLWLPKLLAFSTKEIEVASGVARRTVQYARSGRVPSRTNQDLLRAALVRLLRNEPHDLWLRGPTGLKMCCKFAPGKDTEHPNLQS